MIRLASGIAALALFGIAAGYPPPKADERANADKLAGEAAEAFAKKLTKGDVEGVLAAVEFPVMDSRRTYETADAMRSEMEKVGKAEFAKRKITVKQVLAPDKVPEWAKTVTNPPRMLGDAEKIKAFTDRAGKDGRAVAVEFDFGDSEPKPGVIWLKFKAGKPIIVGVSD